MDNKMDRREFLKRSTKVVGGGLAMGALASGAAQASDRITQMPRETDPMRQVALDLGKKLSKYRAFLPNKFGTNPEAEGAVDKITTEYLNVYALSQRALRPEQRTSEDDVEALKYALEELRQYKEKEVDTSVLKYLYDLLIAAEARALQERENNPRPTGPEREA